MVGAWLAMSILAAKQWFRQRFSRWPDWLAKVRPDAGAEAARLRVVERDLGLPIKAFLLVFLSYYLLVSHWFQDIVLLRQGFLEVVQFFLVIYIVLSVVGAILLLAMDRLPLGMVRDTILVLGMVDALFLGVLTAIAGGFDSILFWIFLVLIVRNAISLPQAGRQITLNLIVTACYVGAGFTELAVQQMEFEMLPPDLQRIIFPNGVETPTEPVLLRVFLLLLVTACGYGVEVLLDRQRRIQDEARESAQRQQQLEAAGRLAAEIAHQLKNPLAIINNAAYTLQRTVKEGKTITQQIRIIREEVDRSDRIITELMGYARLVEGQVERLEIVDEIEQAVQRVFPPAVQFDVRIERDYRPPLPPLLMQRSHLSEVLVNILQNACEAMQGQGTLRLTACALTGGTVEITLADSGPGIPPDVVERIFEPYYSTKDKGTGLGLAIVKHNTELYGGTVGVESTPGAGTRFVLQFPAKSAIRLRR